MKKNNGKIKLQLLNLFLCSLSLSLCLPLFFSCFLFFCLGRNEPIFCEICKSIIMAFSLKHKPFTRFEMEHCNDLWQTDFKGEFRVGDNNYCYPLNILDDHSRFSIRISCTANTKNVVIPAFSEAFREFGLPLAILSDNGGQFAGFRRGYTQFEKWLMRLSVLPLRGRSNVFTGR